MALLPLQEVAQLYINEMHVSYKRRELPKRLVRRLRVRNGKQIAAIMRPLLERETCEVIYVLCLTTRLSVIGYHEVNRGSLDSVTTHPRELFKAAVLANAACIVLVHNHPSGDPSPSANDMALTVRVKNVGKLLGIDLLDHVIIGHHGRYSSFKELGRL